MTRSPRIYSPRRSTPDRAPGLTDSSGSGAGIDQSLGSTPSGTYILPVTRLLAFREAREEECASLRPYLGGVLQVFW